ncbi:MAG TPA: CRTAC1 family protein [Vicinamibacterales bacterium]
MEGRLRLRLGAAALAALLGGAAALTGAQGPDRTSERVRLLSLQREAVSLIGRASRPGNPAGETRAAGEDAVTRIVALAAEPAPDADFRLTQTLRDELRDAARRLERTLAAAADADLRIEAAPLLALLERVRVQIEGEVALGLTFQGSYSRTPPKETVYGGHASAMGPAAPEPPAAEESGHASPLTFEVATRLPTTTWCGGPTKDHILESAGNGLALLDYDGDGLLDIYLVTAAQLTPSRERIPHRNALYRNRGGWQFEDVSGAAGVDAAAWGSGACAGDADGDGLIDLYVTNWGPDFLFRNRGDGTFEEIAARSGITADGWSTGCSFLDADADGDLDLYVARYVRATWDEVVSARRTLVWRNGPPIMVGPAGLPGEPDLFFENRGGGRFVEAAAARGLSDAAGAYGFAVVSTDYDGDGFVDLFVANDSNPNFLYHNLGDGRFESVGLLAGVGVNAEARAQAGMGADAGDYDGDGRLDFVLTAFAHDRNTIYRNVDGRQFEDAAEAAGIAAATFTRMGWGAAFFDADLDTRLDLVIVNGHIFADIDAYPELKETFRQQNQLLLNTGGRFRDVSAQAGAGFQLARVGRGLALGDLDNDGDVDLVISNMDEEPTVLENRQRTGRHWVGVQVIGPEPNRFAIGALVTVESGGIRQMREIRSGGTYLSQGDLRAHFGLGDSTAPVDVEVRMPGGARWRWTGLAPDQLHVLELTRATRVGSGRIPTGR